MSLEGLCAVGRLAVAVLRAGHRVGEEVRQRTQPRHNSASTRRPKLSGCSPSLLHVHLHLRLLLNHPRLNPLRRCMSRKGEEVGKVCRLVECGTRWLEVVVRQTRLASKQAGPAAGGWKLPSLLPQVCCCSAKLQRTQMRQLRKGLKKDPAKKSC